MVLNALIMPIKVNVARIEYLIPFGLQSEETPNKKRDFQSHPNKNHYNSFKFQRLDHHNDAYRFIQRFQLQTQPI